MTKVVIVNEHDEVIGTKERHELDHPNDIYRVTALWLTNSQGDILISQRGLNKKDSPGLWGPAVAGTVDEGEAYDNNIVKEIEEEIGISVSIGELNRALCLPPKQDSGRRYFCQWYLLTLDLPLEAFSIPRDEVEAIRWISVSSLKQELDEHPERFLPSFSRHVTLFIKP